VDTAAEVVELRAGATGAHTELETIAGQRSAAAAAMFSAIQAARTHNSQATSDEFVQVWENRLRVWRETVDALRSDAPASRPPLRGAVADAIAERERAQRERDRAQRQVDAAMHELGTALTGTDALAGTLVAADAAATAGTGPPVVPPLPVFPLSDLDIVEELDGLARDAVNASAPRRLGSGTVYFPPGGPDSAGHGRASTQTAAPGVLTIVATMDTNGGLVLGGDALTVDELATEIRGLPGQDPTARPQSVEITVLGDPSHPHRAQHRQDLATGLDAALGLPAAGTPADRVRVVEATEHQTATDQPPDPPGPPGPADQHDQNGHQASQQSSDQPTGSLTRWEIGAPASAGQHLGRSADLRRGP
jgi:hypothetical protein